MPTTSTNANAIVQPPPLGSTDIVSRLESLDPAVRLKALREVKNQIIGNRTKKLAFLKLGMVPVLSSILDSALSTDESSNILVQSAAALGSFSCGFDPGVQAVLSSCCFSNLIRLLSHPDDKVVDAGSRALRMIYQSRFSPKFDFLEPKNMGFLVSLLDSHIESVSCLGAGIISHSCHTSDEQEVLYDAGVVTRLVNLLNGSPNQRHASLEALAAMYDKNGGIIEFRVLTSIIELTKDRCLRTKLLACSCLVVAMDSSANFMQEKSMKCKLVCLLLDLLDNPGQVGDETPFVFSRLIYGKEDMQKIAFESNAVDKFFSHLQTRQLHPRRLEGLFLVLGDLCSALESCRSKFLSLKGLDAISLAFKHENDQVRAAACTCLRSVTRSIQNLCAGYFMNESLIVSLMKLLEDSCNHVRVSALTVICNIVINPISRKSVFAQCGGINQLVQLSKSMESSIRQKALCALRNSVFLTNKKCKEEVFTKLSTTMLVSLICDPEPSVQEQALGLVKNLVDGCVSCNEYALAEGGKILDAVGKQVKTTQINEVRLQGMHVLINVASGHESHKEAVMMIVLPVAEAGSQPFLLDFLRSSDNLLRTAAVWAGINLTHPSCPGAYERLLKLQNSGIVSQIRSMINDPCFDVKFRVETMVKQCSLYGEMML